MSETKRKSGCCCGAVQLEITGEPTVMAYCHCDSCRSWLGAPVHAATLWPTPNVVVARGEENLLVFKKTDASHRHSCTKCGSPVLIRHPALGMTDVPAGSVSGLDYAPTLHVNYGERVLAIRDGLPKFSDFPENFGGTGKTLPD